jgi:hypothetical protein
MNAKTFCLVPDTGRYIGKIAFHNLKIEISRNKQGKLLPDSEDSSGDDCQRLNEARFNLTKICGSELR